MGSINQILALLDGTDSRPPQDDVPEDVADGNAFGAFEAAREQAAELANMEAEGPCLPEEAPCDEPAPLPPQDPASFEMPPKQYMQKGQRYTLTFQGVCSHCAHCGQPLSDSVSIERGIGPVCSKKGYHEDPTDPDEMQAMIDLAEYPDLVDFLTARYKPQGVRGLMNGLVKVCSLNRRSPVHQACCDAVESLGYRKLASLLRESIAVVEVKDCKEHPGCFHVWVKKSEWSWGWTNSLRAVPGAHFSRHLKGTIVPVGQKAALWELMLKYYEGFCAKVPAKDGTGQHVVKLQRKEKKAS
jgi:hypothetical protein